MRGTRGVVDLIGLQRAIRNPFVKASRYVKTVCDVAQMDLG